MNFKKNSLIFIIKLNEILNKSFILVYFGLLWFIVVYCNIFFVYFFSYYKYIMSKYDTAGWHLIHTNENKALVSGQEGITLDSTNVTGIWKLTADITDHGFFS